MRTNEKKKSNENEDNFVSAVSIWWFQPLIAFECKSFHEHKNACKYYYKTTNIDDICHYDKFNRLNAIEFGQSPNHLNTASVWVCRANVYRDARLPLLFSLALHDIHKLSVN